MKKKISALMIDERGNIFDVPFKNFDVIAAFKLKKIGDCS